MSQSICPKCHTEFVCCANENAPCWCAELPNILPVTSGECMCRSCLTKEIDKFREATQTKMKYNYKDGLTTERLTTRFLTNADSVAWTTFLSDKDCTEFFPKAEFKTTAEWSVFWIDKQITRYKEHRYGLQALIDKNTGKLIGQCGLLLQEVDGKQELEVGYHILKEHWGKGYATEAARMFKQYGFQHQLSESIISIIDQNNIRSQNVARKNGMKKEKATKWNGLDVFIFRTANTDPD